MKAAGGTQLRRTVLYSILRKAKVPVGTKHLGQSLYCCMVRHQLSVLDST